MKFYHFGIKGHAVLVLHVVSYHDSLLLDFGYECSMDFRRRKTSLYGTLSVIEVMDGEMR